MKEWNLVVAWQIFEATVVLIKRLLSGKSSLIETISLYRQSLLFTPYYTYNTYFSIECKKNYIFHECIKYKNFLRTT